MMETGKRTNKIESHNNSAFLVLPSLGSICTHVPESKCKSSICQTISIPLLLNIKNFKFARSQNVLSLIKILFEWIKTNN
jgi:hypothetical protein